MERSRKMGRKSKPNLKQGTDGKEANADALGRGVFTISYSQIF